MMNGKSAGWSALVLAVMGCGEGLPPAPAPRAPPPVFDAMFPTSGDPLASPVTVTLTGDRLLSSPLVADAPLLLEATDRTDQAITFRLSYQSAPPGQYWIRMNTFGGADSAAFTVEPLPAGSTLNEARALWVSRFEFANATDVITIMDRAAQSGFNLVYFQVRGRADALYQSTVEPWAKRLTGTLGQDPGWDPLGVALAEAQRHGIELHAWTNAFTGWAGSTPPEESTPRHAFLEHPEWAMVDAGGAVMPYASGSRWLTPGHPGVRTRLATVAADILRAYAVDGIHLDFIRYPDTDHSYDAASLAAYDSVRAAGEPNLDFAEMRRRFVTWAVRETRDSVMSVSTTAHLSAAVWGVYDNALSWTGVSTGRNSVLQDARAWDRLGLVDALVPMVYWEIEPAYGGRLDFAYLSDEHATALSGPAYIGIFAPATANAGLPGHIERARLAGAEGISVFSYTSVDSLGIWPALRSGAFYWPATPR